MVRVVLPGTGRCALVWNGRGGVVFEDVLPWVLERCFECMIHVFGWFVDRVGHVACFLNYGMDSRVVLIPKHIKAIRSAPHEQPAYLGLRYCCTSHLASDADSGCLICRVRQAMPGVSPSNLVSSVWGCHSVRCLASPNPAGVCVRRVWGAIRNTD